VERWPIDRLIPYAKNARTHTDAQVAAIAASIKEWGWTTPTLVGEDGGLIAGHARVLAARQLGIAEIPVMVAAGWSEAQKRAYVLADNQLAITGSGWDPELLRLELGELKLGGFDLSLTGFGDLELKDLPADRTDGLTDPDDAPAVPEHHGSALALKKRGLRRDWHGWVRNRSSISLPPDLCAAIVELFLSAILRARI
jgi:ParB-like chromosome segregation protein Spo0J